MLGQDYDISLVTTSSNRRRTSAFGIDQLLGLSRRDITVTSFTPPIQLATVSSAEGQQRPPVVNGDTSRCCCLVDVEDWTDASSDKLTARLGLPATPSSYSANTDTSRLDEQHREGIEDSLVNTVFVWNLVI